MTSRRSGVSGRTGKYSITMPRDIAEAAEARSGRTDVEGRPGRSVHLAGRHDEVGRYAALLATSSTSASAAGPEEAGFCPVISRPSWTTYGAQSSPLE